MKKIKQILKLGCIATFFLCFFSCFNIKQVYAEQDIIIEEGGEKLDDFAYYRHKSLNPQLAKSHRIPMMKMKNSNLFVYCIQPGTPLYDGHSYDGYTTDYDVVSNLTKEQWKMISLIAYYGYQYVDPANHIDHSAAKWYSVTQMLIWQYATTEYEIYFSKSIRDERIEKYVEETAELKKLVEDHMKSPNFGENIVTYVGKNLVLKDTNQVLNGYKVTSSKNVNATIAGNELTITSNTTGDFSVTLQKDFNMYSNPPIVYVSATSQNVMAHGNLDPIVTTIKGTTLGGKLILKKYDSITKTCTPQKEGKLVGTIFKLYKKDGTYMKDLTIGNDCSVTVDNLELGEYYVVETQAGTRYELDTTEHHFTITGEHSLEEMTVYNTAKFGKLSIKKYDSITKTCTPQKDGKLAGTIYKLYKEDGSFVKDLVIGSNCEATAEHLDLGRYYLLESQAGTRYELDLEKHYFEITLENLNQNMTLYDNAKFGRLNLKKVDSVTNSCVSQENSTLEGAIYKLYKDDGTYVKDLIIDSNCSASADNLDVGRYYVLESKAPLHYELDTEKHYFDLTVNQLTVDLVVKDAPILGQVSIEKHDSKNHTCTPRGNATLVGAIYGIYKKNGEKIAELTIGNDCKATSEKNLIVGEYYLQEITAPKGYKTDMKKHYFSVTDSNYKTTIQLTVEDEVYTTTIHINKTYLVENGVKAEVGATFDVISKTTGKVVATITIDDSGNGSVTVPYDEYRIHQTTGVKGYKKSADIDLSVNENVKNDTYYALLNEPYSAKVRVIKKDNYGNTVPMAGIRFKIYDVLNDRYVCQNVTYPTVQSICEFVTDQNGEFITPKDLFPSTYLLEEVDQPLNGYLWNKKPLEFVVDENTETMKDKDLGEILVLNFVNEEVKGKIEIQKIGEKVVIEDGAFTYIEIPLPNIVFGLYDESGNLVGKYTTDANGFIKIEDLKLGKYVLRELETDDKYVLDEKEYNIELKYQDQYTAIVTETFTLKNYLKKGNLDFSKTDLVTGKEIPNVKIEVYTENDELIYSGITNEEGKITIEDLFVGKFYIIETEAATGYRLSDEKVYFEILENGDIVKAKMTNEKITGKLEFTKKDLSTDEPLPNTLIEIYKADTDELVFSGRTDEEGKIVIEELEYGKYYIVEKEAPEGYVLNPEKMYFEILIDGEIIKSQMLDKKITGSLDFKKTDFVDDTPLPNTKIRIENENGETIFEGVTDEEGNIIIHELEYGNYCLIESEAPKGYVLNDEALCFSITEDGEIIKAKMTNKKITSKVKLHKVDENNNAIAGVIIGVYNTQGDLIGSYVTDENGDIEVELEYGSYYFQEISTVDGYILSDEKVYFDVTLDGEVIQKTLINELEEIEVPNTLSNDYWFLFPIALLVISFTLLYSDARKEKDKKVKINNKKEGRK